MRLIQDHYPMSHEVDIELIITGRDLGNSATFVRIIFGPYISHLSTWNLVNSPRKGTKYYRYISINIKSIYICIYICIYIAFRLARDVAYRIYLADVKF